MSFPSQGTTFNHLNYCIQTRYNNNNSRDREVFNIQGYTISILATFRTFSFPRTSAVLANFLDSSPIPFSALLTESGLSAPSYHLFLFFSLHPFFRRPQQVFFSLSPFPPASRASWFFAGPKASYRSVTRGPTRSDTPPYRLKKLSDRARSRAEFVPIAGRAEALLTRQSALS